MSATLDSMVPDFSKVGQAPYNQVRLMHWRESTLDMEKRTVSGWASTPEIDSYEEIILPTAFEADLDEYRRNPVMYWNHMWYTIPIAKAIELLVQPNDGLWVTTQVGTTSIAQEVWTALAIDKTVRSMSVGFRGDYTPEYGYWDKVKDLWVWTYVRLMEISIVGMPANKGAQFQLSKSMGLPMMHAVRLAGHRLLASPSEWDKASCETRLQEWAAGNESKLRSCYLIDGQLPVADVDAGDVGLSWPAIANSAAQLFGARGGVKASPAAKRQAFNVLAGLYKQVGKPVPTWKGEWPESLRDVQFHAQETDVLETALVVENARTVLNAARSLANGVTHLRKSQRGPSQDVETAVSRSIEELQRAMSVSPRSASEEPDGDYVLIQM